MLHTGVAVFWGDLDAGATVESQIGLSDGVSAQAGVLVRYQKLQDHDGLYRTTAPP
jgi:hypothetical protein